MARDLGDAKRRPAQARELSPTELGNFAREIAAAELLFESGMGSALELVSPVDEPSRVPVGGLAVHVNFNEIHDLLDGREIGNLIHSFGAFDVMGGVLDVGVQQLLVKIEGADTNLPKLGAFISFHAHRSRIDIDPRLELCVVSDRGHEVKGRFAPNTFGDGIICSCDGLNSDDRYYWHVRKRE